MSDELAAVMKRDLQDHALLQAILAATLARDAHVIEIGAHHGAVLAEMIRCAPGGRHLAFEPLPAYAAYLRQHFADADVREVALADRAGESTFTHVVDLPAYSGLRRRTLPEGEHEFEEITVRTERLDDVVPPDFAPSFIKIDVEGGELAVLRGGAETIRRHQPVIVFEHGAGASEHYGHRSGEVYDVICGECGLRIYNLDGEGPYSRDQFEELFEAPVWNFIARS